MCLFGYYFSVCIDNLLTLYNLLHTLLHCILYAEGAFGKFWEAKIMVLEGKRVISMFIFWT